MKKVKKLYRIKAQKTTGGELISLDKQVRTYDIGNLIKLLGGYGWIVQTFHEV